MNPLPVSSKALLHRDVRAGDRLMPDASLLPLFDDAGIVRQLMLVLQEGPRLVLLESRSNLVRVPWAGPIVLDVPAERLREARDDQVLQAMSLWHLDPTALLSGERHRRDASALRLRETNCAGRWTAAVRMLYFRRDLSKVRLVSTAQAGSVQFLGWKQKFLPARTPVMRKASPAALVRKGAWILKPIWE